MHFSSSRMRLAVAFLLAGALAASPALAQKPDWAGGGKKDEGQKAKAMHEQNEGKGKQKGGHGDKDDADHGKSGDRGEKREHSYFTAQHRDSLHEYFSGEFRKGKGDCPPGLAKKRNGCMPPGQAKKWGIGRPLPKDAVIFDLPDAIIIKLGKPPEGQRFVRVAQDILLIAVGTNMVMDAIEDLSWEFGK